MNAHGAAIWIASACSTGCARRGKRRAPSSALGAVLVSAINEDVGAWRRATVSGFWLGFLASAEGYEMGCQRSHWGSFTARNCGTRLGTFPCGCARRWSASMRRHYGRGRAAQRRLLRVRGPFERLAALELPAPAFEHSPITGIHLWFDRAVTDLPMPRCSTARCSGCSTSRRALSATGGERVARIGARAGEIVHWRSASWPNFSPRRRGAPGRAHVIKELRATFSQGGHGSAAAGFGNQPCGPVSGGDWTRSGWPATMEGAVRSGYLARRR